MVRSRSSRRQRNRRSRTRSRQRNSWQSGNKFAARNGRSRSFNHNNYIAQPLQHQASFSSSLPGDQSLSQPQNASQNSVLSNMLSRVTDFWRRDEKLDGGISGVMFDETDSDSVDMVTKDPSALTIQEPQIPKYIFQCQLAHGSPTALLSDFNNPTELYKKIASSYDDVSFDQILFCTRNTHRVDMDMILSGTLTTTDFIFAHLRGQKKEVELVKEKELLGVTLSDNWAGRVFVRKIDPSYQLAKVRPAVEVGDHIEEIGDESMVGKRHFQVASILRKIPVGEKFTIRLISPLKNGFSFISPRNGTSKKFTSTLLGSSAENVKTIRFKGGKAVIEEPSNKMVIDRLNSIFDNYLGFIDEELANTVLDIGRDCKSLQEMESHVKESALKDFDFVPEFLFDLWGTVNDWKANYSNDKNVATPSTASTLIDGDISKAVVDVEADVGDYKNNCQEDIEEDYWPGKVEEEHASYPKNFYYDAVDNDDDREEVNDDFATTKSPVYTFMNAEDEADVLNAAAAPLPPPPVFFQPHEVQEPQSSQQKTWTPSAKMKNVHNIVQMMDVD